ncbi:uncharacterized protein LOC126761625 [Bactrocera neohumeralis]|uniref:uncharacterized protein LOC126761625 n=1 Tax=Bactrocera neohumeralis TaxID=98809 RepID=UPI00216604FE|nr:uncharacterized protein LOC126761625 [Bactrocera neohumeralis]
MTTTEPPTKDNKSSDRRSEHGDTGTRCSRVNNKTEVIRVATSRVAEAKEANEYQTLTKNTNIQWWTTEPTTVAVLISDPSNRADAVTIPKTPWISACSANGYPTITSAPHSVAKGSKNLLVIAAATEVDFKEAATIKEFIKNPSKFVAAVTSAPAACAGDAPVKNEETEKQESESKSEEDDDMDFGLFG